jgi:acetyl-CoA C-acetyltransferase/acetyl-CoA acyltransferase
MMSIAKRLVVVDGVRTPFARIGTDLAGLDADELGRIAVNALLARTAIDPGVIDEVIMGCVGQPMGAVNVARVIALRAGIPQHVPAITVSRNCASGCEALTQAQEKMMAGRGSIFVVGGVESMTRYPLLFRQKAAVKFVTLTKAKTLGQKLHAMSRFRPAEFAPQSALFMGLTDPVSGLNMGETAELITREHSITRQMQDEFALVSHQRTIAARNRVAEEICPVYIPPDFKRVMVEDNGPRPDQSLEALAKLKPVFDHNMGTVTAGNSSQLTDGGVALLVMSEAKATELGYAPLGALTGYSYTGCDPARMGLGPLNAMAQAEAQTGLTLKDADIVEINEAFAGQVLTVLKLAESKAYAHDVLDRSTPLGEIPRTILNVNGGAVALGHPVGATGARLILSSLKELHRQKARRALVSLCVGGGQGAALWLERL